MDVFQVSRDARMIYDERIRGAMRGVEEPYAPMEGQQTPIETPPRPTPTRWLGQVARLVRRPTLIWRHP